MDCCSPGTVTTQYASLFSVQTHVNCAPATSSFTEAVVTVSTMTLHVYVLFETLHQFGTCIITVSVNTDTMKSIINGTCSFVIRVKLVAIPICDCSGHHLSETEEETNATTQLEGIVDCALQLAHAS